MVNKEGSHANSRNGPSRLPLRGSDEGKLNKMRPGAKERKSRTVNLTGPEISHKAVVEPIFLAYN